VGLDVTALSMNLPPHSTGVGCVHVLFCTPTTQQLQVVLLLDPALTGLHVPHLPASCSHHGADCTYLHRLPTAADEERHRTDYSHDIFGRGRNPASPDGRKKGVFGKGGSAVGELGVRGAAAGINAAGQLLSGLPRVGPSIGLPDPPACIETDWLLPAAPFAGVGSYEREFKTLYVNYGGAGPAARDQGKQNGPEGLGQGVVLVPCRGLAYMVLCQEVRTDVPALDVFFIVDCSF